MPLMIRSLRAARSTRFDLAIAGHVLAAPAAWFVARLQHIPYVLVAHAMELRAKRGHGLIRGLVCCADHIITNSAFTKDECIRLGARPEAIQQTALGFSVSDSEAHAPRAQGALCGRWKHLEGKQIILSVARLSERYKGHDILIHALPLVAAKVPEALCVIVGEGWLRPYYESLSHSLGVTDKVLFTGAIIDEELRAFYEVCDVFALCSRERLIDGGAEGFGIVFIEANSYGKPVVGGRSGGIPDAVIDGVTGLLVSPTNELEIADALIRLLTDEGLAHRLGQQGRERAFNELRWEKVIGGIEEVLVQAVGSRKSRRK